MDTPETTAGAAGQGANQPAAAPAKTVAEIAQELLASPTSTADQRRLAAWVLDHDEHAEATLVSQSRLSDRLDAMARRGKQRALAAGGALGGRLAPAAGFGTLEHQDPPTSEAPQPDPAAPVADAEQH